MEKLSCLLEERQYNREEIAAHIKALRDEFGYLGICPALREAVLYAPYVSEKDFVAAAITLKLNPKTVQQQFRKTRRHWAIQDLIDEGKATPELINEMDNWKWQSASTKQQLEIMCE